MVLGRLFGLGKQTEPFRAPREVNAVRMRIDSESRENFPNLSRYKEIARETEVACSLLDDLIVQGAYADEARKSRDDLQRKLSVLAAKIKGNMRDGRQEKGGADFVDKNIDYLERKSMRNGAKDLFVDFLEAHDALSQSSGLDALEASTLRIVTVLTDLNERFLRPFPADQELQSVRAQVLEKMTGLNAFFNENKDRFVELDMLEVAAASQRRLAEAARSLSVR
jgi:hypothetical protein